MVGYTIWSLRNIFTIIYLFENNCLKGTTKIDKFWLLNFYFFTLLGYFISILTLLIFPGAALYQCYRQTDRENDMNLYRGQTIYSNGTEERRVSTKMFDEHVQAENHTFQKLSENQQSLEDFRQNVIDVLVRKTWPKSHIK